MAKILIVEDSIPDQKLYRRIFERDHELVLVANLKELAQSLEQFEPELIILDLFIGNEDGFQALEMISQAGLKSSVPIFFVSGSKEVEHRVRALSLGAVDFIVKPFDFVELRLRVVNALARHIQLVSAPVASITVGELSIDMDRHLLMLRHLGESHQVALTRKEAQLLKYFMSNEGRVLSRSKILKAIWGTQTHVISRAVDNQVSALRKKCGLFGDHFESVYGEGYRFNKLAK